jgi:hypothetical protein
MKEGKGAQVQHGGASPAVGGVQVDACSHQCPPLGGCQAAAACVAPPTRWLALQPVGREEVVNWVAGSWRGSAACSSHCWVWICGDRGSGSAEVQCNAVGFEAPGLCSGVLPPSTQVVWAGAAEKLLACVRRGSCRLLSHGRRSAPGPLLGHSSGPPGSVHRSTIAVS